MAMREMKSSIGSSPHQLARNVGEAVNRSQAQQVRQAAPEIAMAGTSDPDYKKSVTEAFTNMVPVHKNSGNAVVGGLAYRTNELAWRDYNPGFFQGLYAPAGEYSSKPYYYTDMVAAESDPSVIKTGDPADVKFGEAVTPNRSLARPFATQVVQDTDTF